jgi:hypothetical protein
MVAALEPMEGDSVVMTRIGNVRTYQHIDQYDKAVSYAVKMADMMHNHVDVVPMDVSEFVKVKTGTPFSQYVRSLPAAALLELRQLAIEACEDALRNSSDADVRAQAATTLVQLGVLRAAE